MHKRGVAGERADLDGRSRADERREHRHERALLGRDLHPGDRAERRGRVDQRLLHRVGPLPVREEVLVHLG